MRSFEAQVQWIRGRRQEVQGFPGLPPGVTVDRRRRTVEIGGVTLRPRQLATIQSILAGDR